MESYTKEQRLFIVAKHFKNIEDLAASLGQNMGYIVIQRRMHQLVISDILVILHQVVH